jgi:hypothetical protein
MKPISILTTWVLISSAAAQQVPAPKTSSGVTAPADGISMSPAYARALAKSAYIWGWPMISMVPHPGRNMATFEKYPRKDSGLKKPGG